MDERTCDQCGAQNAMDAAYCWRCYARWGGSASPSAPVRHGTIQAVPVGAYGGGPGGSVLTAPPPPLVGAPAGRSWGRLLAAAVVFVAGLAGGWWLVDRLFFGGFPFPDEVADHERVDSDRAEEVADALTSLGGLLDVEMEFAFYGSEIEPAYVMFAFDIPDGINPTTLQGFPIGDVLFQCRPEIEGSSCFWQHDGMIVGLGGNGPPDGIEPVARRVQTELQAET